MGCLCFERLVYMLYEALTEVILINVRLETSEKNRTTPRVKAKD